MKVLLSCASSLPVRRDSGFHFHREPSPALCTLILNRYQVVPLVVGDFCKLTTTALDDASLQIQAVHSFFWVEIHVIVLAHVLALFDLTLTLS